MLLLTSIITILLFSVVTSPLYGEQYIDDSSNSDMNYDMGDVVLYDVLLNRRCASVSESCLSTTVIDYDNKQGDTNVTLLPNLYGNYQTSIPKEIRKRCNINKDYVIEWDLSKDGKPEINFRKKRNIKNLIGAFHLEEKTNSVELKRSLYQ